MTPADIARLLGMCSAYDQRTVGQADITAWHHALGDLAVERAAEAVVEHYRNSRDRIMPADVRRLAREIGNRRYVDPSAAEILGWHHTPELDAVAGSTRLPAPRPSSLQRPERDPAEDAALRVPCPFCRAPVGRGCVLNDGHRQHPRTTSHPSRLEAGAAA